MMKTYSLILVLCLLVSNALFAVPSKQVSKTFTQPDGSKVTIVLQGDEHFSYYSTTDGIMLKEDNDGYMRYAVPDLNGDIVSSKYVAQNPQDRNENIKAFLSDIDKPRLSKAVSKQISKSPIMRMPGPIGTSKYPTRGKVRGLIILAQFQDLKFSNGGTQEEFTKMMNEEGYSKNGATGSARDYFIDQSQGQFMPDFDIVGPVTLPQRVSYYGQRVMTTSDVNAAQMIVDACTEARTKVDFSKYDLDNDDIVDLVFVLYAGYSEAAGGPSYTIWPHAWDIKYGGKTLTLNGKSIRGYACSSELKGKSGNELDGIGIFCHEYSHCLGLPDLYDTMNMGGYGMGLWSIMDRGCYNNESRTPPAFSAFERYSVSWYNPDFLETPKKNITLEAIGSSNKAYFIKSDENEDEFYTLENRQPEGWDKYLPGHGLMITHINYQAGAWQFNEVNSPYGFEKLQIVPADNVRSSENMDADAFPGLANNTSFTDESEPAAKLSTGKFLGKPITNISEKDGLISFDFIGDSCLAPEMKNASNITKTSFSTEWSTVENAISYTLEMVPSIKGQLLISEDFSGFKAGNQDKPDETDISGELDKFMQQAGWKGSKVFQAGKTCFLGALEESGYLITPELDLSSNDIFTLCIEVKGTETLYSGVRLAIFDKQDGVKPFVSKNFNLENGTTKIYWTIQTNETTGFLRIYVKDQAYLMNMALYSGDVKKELEEGEFTPSNATSDEQKRIIPDITTNTYELSDLSEGKYYACNVRVVTDKKISEPSNKIVVKTLGDTGINSNPLSTRIHVSGNQLIIFAQTNETINIYTIDGILKRSILAQQGTNSIQMDNGIYIIRSNNQSIKTVVTGK